MSYLVFTNPQTLHLIRKATDQHRRSTTVRTEKERNEEGTHHSNLCSQSEHHKNKHIQLASPLDSAGGQLVLTWNMN